MSSHLYQPVKGYEGGFKPVPTPMTYEGVGKALQAAFCDAREPPAELRECLDRLDHIRI